MSMQSHISVLEYKHQQLDKEIEYAYAHHASDIEIQRMKKYKLRLKEEIYACRRQRKHAA